MKTRNKIKNNMKVLLSLVAVAVTFVSTSCADNNPQKEFYGLHVETPVNSEISKDYDFAYPSHDPSIKAGKVIFQQNCATCHGASAKKNLSLKQMRSRTPVEQFLVVSNGNAKGMPGFKTKLNKEERWDALMYVRAMNLGYYENNGDKKKNMDALFGGNCAVCHGTDGYADGPLHKSLYPQPANFNQFDRLYNRSDETLYWEIANGIPWTAMPAWFGRYDFDKQQRFDEALVRDLVRYVRQFGTSQDIDRLSKGRAKLEEFKQKIKNK